MERIKIPIHLITIILNLFTNRKNSVFTTFGNTDLYDIQIGIDQGEVISPLLWCIYYDPLLCEIEQQKLGYNISHTWKKDVMKIEHTTISQTVSSIAFMDDTTWVAPNQTNLEKILDIADEFYRITNTAINKNKSELIINNNKKDTIDIKFGDATIPIQPSKKPIRFLGVWISFNKNKSFIKQQLQTEIIKFCNIIKRKPLTDRQLIYIFNMVLAPKIMYRLQIYVLTEIECQKLMAPIRKTFKNKLKFATTAPNYLVQNKFLYNLMDIWSLQCQRQSKALVSLFSTNTLLYETAKSVYFNSKKDLA